MIPVRWDFRVALYRHTYFASCFEDAIFGLGYVMCVREDRWIYDIALRTIPHVQYKSINCKLKFKMTRDPLMFSKKVIYGFPVDNNGSVLSLIQFKLILFSLRHQRLVSLASSQLISWYCLSYGRSHLLVIEHQSFKLLKLFLPKNCFVEIILNILWSFLNKVEGLCWYY